MSEHRLEVLDPSGHLTLTWNPEDAASIKEAKNEFDRLKEQGYAFFVGDQAVKNWKAAHESGRIVTVRATEFDPEAERTVAVKPMRGG